MKKIFILMMVATPLFFSCSKSNGDKDNGPDQAAKKLQTDVVGKWQAADISIAAPNSYQNGVVIRTITGKHSGLLTRTKPHGIIVNSPDPGGSGSNVGYIEFLSDSTYMIYDADGNFTQGKFNALSGDSISLGKFGTLGGIKLANNKLDFKLYYSGSSKTVTISANKAPAVASDSRTALLCRAWYLTKEDYGGEIIGSSDSHYNESTQQWEDYTIDSLSFVITTSGTYIVQQFEKSVLKNADVANWKWHSSISNRFIYYWDDMPIDEANDFVVIRENTASVLKLSEYEDDNGNEHELKYTLLPAR